MKNVILTLVSLVMICLGVLFFNMGFPPALILIIVIPFIWIIFLPNPDKN